MCAAHRATQDVLSIVESAYSFDADRGGWIANILDAADRSLGVGLPAIACIFRALPNGTIAVDNRWTAARRYRPETVAAILDGLSSAPPGWLSHYYRPGGGGVYAMLTSEVNPGVRLPYRNNLAREGVRDGLNIMCADLDNQGALISLALPRIGKLPAAARATMVRVGTHILAGFRLRRRLGVDGEPPAETPASADAAAPSGQVEAALTPAGEVVDTTGAAAMETARRALHAAVLEAERAHQEPRRALELWRGRASAHWTVVDELDGKDGNRYVLARTSAPPAHGVDRLTPAERLVVAHAARGLSAKETAYALGLADATVRVLMMRAGRRFNARNRAELVNIARAVAPTADWRHKTGRLAKEGGSR